MLACLRATTATDVGWTRRPPLRLGAVSGKDSMAIPMGEDMANPVVNPRVYQMVDRREVPTVNGSMPINGYQTS